MISKIYKFRAVAFRCLSLARFTLLSAATIAPMLFATSVSFAQKNVLHDRAYVKFLLAVSTPEEDSTVNGGKQYELTNHLGNVLATVSDRRLQTVMPPTGSSGVTADLLSATDYYAFGMEMPGRNFTPSYSYRYGFNGKDVDNEISGDGNSYDYGFRILNSRLGRFLSLDPLQAKYASLTPYNFCGNNPIAAIDPNGRGIIIVTATVSYDGPAPKKEHDMGVTIPSYELTFNQISKVYDIVLTTHITYTSALRTPGANGKTMEQENPGLGLCVETHENTHNEANIAAVKASYQFKTNAFGADQTFEGTADVIATKIFQETNKYSSALFQKAYAKIDLEYAPLLDGAKNDEERSNIQQEKEGKIKQARQEVQAMSEDILHSLHTKVMEMVSKKMEELNAHDGEKGINQQSANKLPEGNAKKYQKGELKVKYQGQELKR